jgi:hypothetical protein
MKRLFFLAALALAAAVGGIFLSSPPAPAPQPLASTPAKRVPASTPPSTPPAAPAPATVTAPKAGLLQALRETKTCFDRENCDFPQTDPRSYSFAVGRRLAEQLSELGAAYSADPSMEAEVAEAAREFMLVQDGFVQEQAMLLMGQLPPNPANVDAMITGLQNSSDPLLVEQAMKEWERYIGTAEESRIQEFLADFIAHGGQFSSEKASEMILSFLNERSLPTFEEKLTSMIPESTPARYLRAALDQYKMQRQGG